MKSSTTKTKRRTVYLHPLKFYEQLYKLPEQTVVNAYKRKWPLDDPRALFDLMANAPGLKSDLRELERIASLKTPKKKDREAPAPKDVEGSLSELSVGLSHEVKRLTEECARSFRDFKNEPSPVHRRSLQRIYAQNVATLQKLVPIATEAEVKAGTLLSSSEVEAAWTRALLEFKNTLEALAARCATAPIFRKLDPVAVKQFMQSEIDKALAHLCEGTWLKPEPTADRSDS